jgi:homocysteine S-methyltransferase
MIDHPDLVGDVHADYFRAEATIASTNSYALHRNRLERVGLEAELLRLVDTALAQAKAARDAHGSGRIAGVLGPLLASYRPDLHPPLDLATARYGELVARMRDHVDLFLIETVSSLLEAEGALAGTVMDEDGSCLRSGEALADIAPLVARFDPDALLINCSRPEAIPVALDQIKGFEKPFGAYANGFTRITEAFLADAPTVDALEQRQDLGPAAYADHVMCWLDQGATIVGGCCEVGPAHIAELARRLRAAGHHIV